MYKYFYPIEKPHLDPKHKSILKLRFEIFFTFFCSSGANLSIFRPSLDSSNNYFLVFDNYRKSVNLNLYFSRTILLQTIRGKQRQVHSCQRRTEGLRSERLFFRQGARPPCSSPPYKSASCGCATVFIDSNQNVIFYLA